MIKFSLLVLLPNDSADRVNAKEDTKRCKMSTNNSKLEFHSGATCP